MTTLKVTKDYIKKPLSRFLSDSGYDIPSPCGGRGTCGKCTVTLADGRKIRACQTLCEEGMEILADSLRKKANETGDSYAYTLDAVETSARPRRCGLALDIGTTTLAFSFADLDKQKVIARRSCLNPQASFGADVITRISQSKLHLSDMQSCLLESIREAVKEYCPLENIIAVGNPTMLSVFAGVSPEPMGHSPFTPAFTEPVMMQGKDLGLDADRITLLSGASAFVGADVLAGVCNTKMTEKDTPSLLLDIGTNGEMALYSPKDQKLYVTSVAAGPAFEGANISCGTGGIEGAVCKIYPEGGRICYETIGNKPAIGLCGSGLMDLMALLLEKEIVDETGAMEEEDYVLYGMQVKNGVLSDCISRVLTLTQKDIREVQLAKSAVRSGIEVLLEIAGIRKEDLSEIYLAGGLGFFLNERSAIRIGMLPEEFSGKTKAIGNGALKGAVECLYSFNDLKQIAKISETVELNKCRNFSAYYVEYMGFE